MKSRMKQPALVLPDAMKALIDLEKAIAAAGPPKRVLDLINLRASQINGCGYCVDMHARDLKQGGETDERLWAVAAWRESRLFSEAERAALGLAEAATRIADRPDAVSDEVWADASRCYDEKQLAAILLQIAGINAWNRLNVAVRQTSAARPVEQAA
jgi:AhpD family alkylhydroperoxidase